MPQEFRIPFKPKKSEMPKKSRVPQTASRRTIGRNYNQMNDKNKSGDDQRVLYNVSNISGRTLTPEGIKRPMGWIHTWGTLLAMVPPLDLPDQQMVLKRTPPAFEVNTRIDVRRDGNQTRIHSFVSTSTINREQIQPSLSLNRTHTKTHPSSSIALPFASARSLFGNQTFYHPASTSTQSAIDIAKRAHELSVFVHQKVHDLYQLVSCSTMRRTDQVKTWIVTGESVEQTSFTTVCQGAIGRAEAQNKQGMKQESEIPSISTYPMTGTNVQGTSHFFWEETARKLSKAFQDSFENQYNATIDTPNHIHKQVTETFWNGLTERFYHFFYQHENTNYTQEQAHGSSLMSYFVEWLLQTFSVDYGNQVPSNPPSEKNLNYQMKTSFSNQSTQTKKKQPEITSEMVAETVLEITPETVSESILEMTPEMILKTVPVLNPEKESFLSQIWQLATDFYGVVDGFLQESIGLQFLGAEAMPLPTTRIPSLELEENQLTFDETQISETTTESSQVNGTTLYIEGTELEVTGASKSNDTQEINEKIQAFLRENVNDPTKIVAQETTEDSDPPEWNSEQKENIRKKLVDFFMENGIACQESNAKDLIETVGEWVLLEDATPSTLDMVKVKQIAKLILEMGEEALISEEQASLTVGSWVYETNKDNQPVALALVAETTKQPEGTSTPSTTSSSQPASSPQSTSVDKRKNKVVETDGIQWRDPNVRKQVEAFFQRKKLLSDHPTKEELLIAMGKRITKEKNNKLIFNHKRLQPLAKVILKALKLNDEKNKENLSNKDAELTIMKWAFETILGSSMEAYMVKTLVSAPDIDQFTMGRLRDLFTVRNLEKEGLIQLDIPTLSQKQKRFFNRLWNFLLQKELPNYFLDSSGLADDLLISDYASLMQLTGAKILKEGGYLESFSPEDSRLMGQHFWENILEKGITIYEEFRHLLMPSLLAVAQLEPDLLREALATGTYKEVAISAFIGYQKEGYYKIIDNQEILDRFYKAYQKNFLQWRRKEALATALAQTCRDKGSLTSFDVIKQNYLIGAADPCPDIDWLPTKLETRYAKLTKNVAEAYLPLDKKLIEFALPAFDKEERAFIFSEGTHLYEANAELKNESDYIEEMPVTSGSPAIHFLLSVRKKKATTLSLNKTDLFVAVNGKEERWYALKQLDGEGGYRFYRVNQDPLLYLKLGLFDQKNLWKNGYKKEGNEIRIGDKLFTFSTHVNRSEKLSQGIETAPFIEVLSRKHSDQLYQQLYDSGNDKADLEKAWEVAKHFIPFYDCVTGIINQDTEEAVVSCTIDALLMIPILGQVTSLNMKFALGVARAFARGGIRNVIRSSKSFLPTMAEIRRLVLTFAQNLDPGFEPLIGGGRLIVRKLVKFKNELHIGKKIKDLLERVEKLEKAQEALKKSIEMLEWKGLEVPVKKVNEHLYMRVTNLETAEVFGGLFMKKGNRIEAYRPATFTTEQLELLNILEKKIDENQMFVVSTNPNPQAYGTGEITTVKKEGEETKRFIRMKGKLIEVTMTAIKEHGFRLDVYAPHLSKSFPVNFNGIEWYFEAPTSPFVTKEVEKKIASMLDQFETQKNPNGLSAPDEKGLMWNEAGRSYVKIKDHYIPLILLDKKLNRYHLVKKDYNESMTVLRFDPKKGQFRLETDLERKQAVEALLSNRSKSLERGENGGAGTSGGAAGPSTSQGAASQINENMVLPPANELPPDPPEHAEDWNKIRGAIAFREEFEIPRVEDDSVPLDELSTFLPEKLPIYYADNEWLKEGFMDHIIKTLPSKPKLDFRVYVGLNSVEVPKSIKLFQQKLVEEFKKAKEICTEAKVTCENLLKKAILSETQEGEYLINMFQLESVSNKEEILKEIINRLKSIAEKGENFLQQTADWGFENIWTVSTDLFYQEASQEYRSRYNKMLQAQAMVQRYDPACRMLIYADAFHLDPDIMPNEQIRPPEHEIVLHETTHLIASTEDAVRYYFVDKNFSKSGEDTLKDFNEIYKNLLESPSFEIFVNHLAESLNMPMISKKTVAEAMKKIPMLRVNFQMTDAEMIMILLRDFADKRQFKQRPHVKRSVNEKKEEELGKGTMFIYLALPHILGDGIFERNIQLNKTQELIAKRTTDTVETTRVTTNRSFLNLVTSSIERSGSPTQIALTQQVSTELPKTTVKKNLLDYGGTREKEIPKPSR